MFFIFKIYFILKYKRHIFRSFKGRSFIMEHLSIDDFVRVEGYLSKKLEEACSLFKKLIKTKIFKTSNGQLLSRDELERIN